ncbi:hypothetical protein LJC61_05290 [Ruminococcaceae bacterium OttesenSCG-928-A16]|nr:hypothetical protein [Ruminococcaceae bacterium OttesenSCG-928-A16]
MINPSYDLKWNGIPILSKIQIDELGEQFVNDFCPSAMQEPCEIDVDRFITNYLGMQLDYNYLSHNAVYLGMTVFGDTVIPVYNPHKQEAEYTPAKAGTIVIDHSLLAPRQLHRYRYTAGHEAGHGVLHALYFNQRLQANQDSAAMVQCRISGAFDTNFATPPEYWGSLEWMEWQANCFSSALLMPRAMVIQLMASLPQMALPVRRRAQAVAAMTQTFNISAEAAIFRLKDLRLLPELASLDID